MTIINPKPEDDELFQLRQKVNGYPVNAEEDTLHLVIGRAITAWSSLENELFLCYLAAFKTDEVVQLSASYHALSSFKIKRDTILATMKYSLHNNPDLLKEWERLDARLKNNGQTRAQIAHYPLVNQMTTDKGTHPILRPCMYDVNVVQTKLNKNNKLPRLGIKEIEKAGHYFSKLSCDLSQFHHRLNPNPKKIPHNLDF